MGPHDLRKERTIRLSPGGNFECHYPVVITSRVFEGGKWSITIREAQGGTTRFRAPGAPARIDWLGFLRAAAVAMLVASAFAAGRFDLVDRLPGMAAVWTDRAEALVAPAIPYVTAAGDAVWSAVRPVMNVFTGIETQVPAVVARCFLVWALLGACITWAAVAAAATWPPTRTGVPFPSAVGFIWRNERPEVNGQRVLPLWMAVLILPVAAVEFGARLCYFVGFTAAVPLWTLANFNLSRFIPFRKSAKDQG